MARSSPMSTTWSSRDGTTGLSRISARVFVTGNREFYEKVLLNEDRKELWRQPNKYWVFDQVFVTGNREFYEKVLLNEDRMKLMVEMFMERHTILFKAHDLIRWVWLVSKDHQVIRDEVYICLPCFPEISQAPERQPIKSDFLPNELELVSSL
ncbi:hypothetical protein SELMODRAFT_407507 [Selaginella moellendorffii]|uniref:Uncharacterized protein n=1 Tax=Selaginella moellendorffii TaxID=88036 RepID=D8R5U6_SELML|nr:hypothetical protein SELMODRAFT_407507 [Selaginella moellendorffii]